MATIAGCFTSLQAQSYATTVSYDKTTQPALVLPLPYSENIAEDFIVANLKKTGYDAETKGKLFWKKNKLNGFYVFKGVMLNGLSSPLDLYFRVDPKSRGAKDQSTIYLLASHGNENFIPPTDTAVYTSAAAFLNNFVTESAAYKLNLDIEAQKEAVKESEKKLAKLIDNGKDMEKKLIDLQNDLKKNKADQEAQQKAIEEERRKLEELKQKAGS